MFELITPLLIRGQQTGGFNPELPIAWMLTARLELVHAASLSVTNGAPAPDQAKRALVDCTLGALEPSQASRG